jgi:hypothetical protein
MTASGGVMRDSALLPQSMAESVLDGVKSTGGRRFSTRKIAYFQ